MHTDQAHHSIVKEIELYKGKALIYGGSVAFQEAGPSVIREETTRKEVDGN